MKRVVVIFVLMTVAAVAASTVSRASVAALEKSFNNRLDREVLDGDPFLLLGMTQGIYIEGFGVVYAAEVNLMNAPGINPFHPEMTKADWQRIRQRKLQRLPALRQAMKSMLLDSAASLDGMPAEEQLVVGVRITRQPGEDATGIPSQIVMRAQKRGMLDVHTGRVARSQMDALIKVNEN
ncbi:MAG: hypothetical protein HY820_16630 [Acidobacteria bacterium]|nr:hypothetical protein [Acidobacteriota bacterium]